MRECRAAFYIAQGINAGDVGFQFVIYLNSAALTRFNASFSQVQRIGLRDTANSNQHV